MINHKHKFIFVHIPKTGGRSIEKALANYGIDDIVRRHGNGKLKNPHFTINKYLDTYIDFDLKSYFWFTTIRNPYERFVSEYFYSKRQKKTVSSFKEWVIFDEIEQTSYPLHSASQLSFTSSERRQIDYTIRFENLQQDFNFVCDKIGIPRQQLPHENKTKHKHYTEYYDDETREIVAQKYAKDIEYFGYEF